MDGWEWRDRLLAHELHIPVRGEHYLSFALRAEELGITDHFIDMLREPERHHFRQYRDGQFPYTDAEIESARPMLRALVTTCREAWAKSRHGAQSTRGMALRFAQQISGIVEEL